MRKARNAVTGTISRYWTLRMLVACGLTLLIIRLFTPLLALVFPYIHFTATWGNAEILAFIAIVFALMQFLDARDEEGRLGKIAGQMSTQVIGTFPENLDDVAELIGTARTSIDIVVDFFSYGQYSAPQAFQKYLNALKLAAKKSKMKFRIAAYNSDLAKGQIKAQFSEPEFGQEREEDRFKDFCRKAMDCGRKKPANSEDFCELLQDFDQVHMNSLKNDLRDPKNLQKVDRGKTLTLFVWLVDDREAIFTFGHIERERHVYSIRTRDQGVVDQLKHYVNAVFDEDEDVSRPQPNATGPSAGVAPPPAPPPHGAPPGTP
jgi:hypothetical protein